MMSLRLRVVLAITLLLLTGSVVGTALAGWQAKQVLREELAAALSGGRQTVAGAFLSLPRSDDPSRDLRRLVAAFDGDRHLRATLLDARGRTIRRSSPLPASHAPAWFSALLHPDTASVALGVPGSPEERLLLEPVSTNDVAGLWAEFLDLIIVLTISLGVGSGLVWLTVGQALRPLSEFAAAFVRIGSGDYGARVREAGPSELVRLGRGVNEMAAQLAAMRARTHRLEEQLRTLQDEERADLARDLHDEIGPHLFAVNVDAAMARRLIGEGRAGEASRQVEAIQRAVGHMQRLVRDILGRLRPTELIELGLKAAIDELVAFWSARHPEIVFSVQTPDDETLSISDEARETVYRVIQEALNNAVRHGRPARIEVRVESVNGDIVARVTDDGAPTGRTEGAGFGLRGMRERVAAARGDLAITRRPDGGGWSVRARLPVPVSGGDLEARSAA
jgi:two-component system sensor histidine kinase UhpB